MISSSYEIIGRVLSSLLHCGLRRQDITPSDGLGRGNSQSRDDVSHFMDVMIWLSNEGLITHSGPMMNGTYRLVQLTSRGLAMAEVKTFDKEHDLSIRETVEQQSAGGLSSPTYGKIGSFVGGLMGGFTKAIS